VKLRKIAHPKTPGQKQYLSDIDQNTITICVGPAGTGKSCLAVAKALEALVKKKVNNIILTHPAIEAGEWLGFLRGDLMNKVDPYLRPLYDSLGMLLGPGRCHRF
jgi:phosphate starvation-inducible PhoH-like protein